MCNLTYRYWQTRHERFLYLRNHYNWHERNRLINAGYPWVAACFYVKENQSKPIDPYTAANQNRKLLYHCSSMVDLYGHHYVAKNGDKLSLKVE